MPVINSYDRCATEIKRGNYLFGKKVTLVQSKRTNTYITLEEPVDGKNQWIFKHNDMLEVGVEERTPEENEARRLETIEMNKDVLADAVDSWIAGALEGVDIALADMQKRRENGWGALDYSAINEYLKAAADDKVATALRVQLHNAIEDHGLSRVEAVIAILNHEAQQFASRAMRVNVLSRSTNITANLCEDLEISAWGQFFNSLSYKTAGIPELKVPSRY